MAISVGFLFSSGRKNLSQESLHYDTFIPTSTYLPTYIQIYLRSKNPEHPCTIYFHYVPVLLIFHYVI